MIYSPLFLQCLKLTVPCEVVSFLGPCHLKEFFQPPLPNISPGTQQAQASLPWEKKAKARKKKTHPSAFTRKNPPQGESYLRHLPPNQTAKPHSGGSMNPNSALSFQAKQQNKPRPLFLILILLILTLHHPSHHLLILLGLFWGNTLGPKENSRTKCPFGALTEFDTILIHHGAAQADQGFPNSDGSY